MLGYSFFGADHILFGTDAPFGPKYGVTLETIKSVERMSIPDIDKEKIFMQNAVNLLRLAI
jgi:predicted TIM-barrel fold metal-dependent hydrolase